MSFYILNTNTNEIPEKLKETLKEKEKQAQFKIKEAFKRPSKKPYLRNIIYTEIDDNFKKTSVTVTPAMQAIADYLAVKREASKKQIIAGIEELGFEFCENTPKAKNNIFTTAFNRFQNDLPNLVIKIVKNGKVVYVYENSEFNFNNEEKQNYE